MFTNKKGQEEQTMSLIIYLVLIAIFVVGMLYYLYSQKNGAGIWEDFYAKEISRVINSAQAGDEIIINVQKGTEIADRNKVLDANEMFIIKNNEICVKLGTGKRSCYSYFNDLDVIAYKVDLRDEKNILKINMGERNE